QTESVPEKKIISGIRVSSGYISGRQILVDQKDIRNIKGILKSATLFPDIKLMHLVQNYGFLIRKKEGYDNCIISLKMKILMDYRNQTTLYSSL
ncbi:hypothetical protein CEXT_752681, partial [Caerostris extrusa]